MQPRSNNDRSEDQVAYWFQKMYFAHAVVSGNIEAVANYVKKYGYNFDAMNAHQPLLKLLRILCDDDKVPANEQDLLIILNLLLKADATLVNYKQLKARYGKEIFENDSPLHIAASGANLLNVCAVRALLRNKEVDKNALMHGSTALMSAVHKRAKSVIALFTSDMEVDVNVKDTSNRNALMIAANSNQAKVVTMLLARPEQLLKEQSNTGRTALACAVLNGSDKIFDALLAKDGIDINTVNNKGHTPLVTAIIRNNSHAFTRLLARDEIDVKSHDIHQCNVLATAAALGRVEMLDALLKRQELGCDALNHRDHAGNTPLTWAIKYNRFDSAAHLLASGLVNLETTKPSGETALLMAVKKNDIEMARLLLQHGADVTHGDLDGNTPRSIAISNNNYAIVKLLKEFSKNANDKGKAELKPEPATKQAPGIGLFTENEMTPDITNIAVITATAPSRIIRQSSGLGSVSSIFQESGITSNATSPDAPKVCYEVTL